MREAPSLDCIPILLEDGAHIKAFDPVGEDNYKKMYPTQIEYCKNIDDTIKNADLCMIFTEWKEIKDYDMKNYEKLMNKAIVLDGRNCYSLEDAKKCNIIYNSIGREEINNL